MACLRSVYEPIVTQCGKQGDSSYCSSPCPQAAQKLQRKAILDHYKKEVSVSSSKFVVCNAVSSADVV